LGVTDDTGETLEPPKKGIAGLTQQFLKPKKTKDIIDSYGTGIIPFEDRKQAMQSLNRTEQRLGYIAAGLAVLMGGLATLIFPRTRVTSEKPVKGVCPSNYSLVKGTCEAVISNQVVAITIVTMVFAVAIFVAVRIRRRTPAVFASLITGVAFMSFSIEVGAPFLIYGGWLLLRARRIQKYGTTDAKTVAGLAGEERAARKAGQPSPAAQRQAKEATSSTAPATTAKPSAGAPDPSGRYTPKAPTRKKPVAASKEKKPSRWRARLEGLDEES
jgi:hypothetical protein